MASSAINTRNRNMSGNRSSSIPCRYFSSSGCCRSGSRCRYSHDRNMDRSLANLCKFYQRGNCVYGESCRYEHVRPLHFSREQEPAATASGVEPSSRGTSSTASKIRTHSSKNTKLRADAQEFVPACMSDANRSFAECSVDDTSSDVNSKDMLCPYHILGHCWYGNRCSFIHGTICDLCDRAVLYPENEELNRKHRQECLAEHEKDMQAAFAAARAKEKTCGICMEVVMEKANVTSRRFGILPGCKHCFCLDCIRQWRQAKTFENKVIRACPECRTVSDFVTPSTIWVEEDEEKRSLIDSYRSAMKEKSCKYFLDGKVECPFGNKCFYRHVKPDGTVVRGDSPRTILRRQRRRERRQSGGGGGRGNGGGDLFLFWDFLEENDWRRSRLSFDDLPWEFRIEDELDWLSLTDSESDFYDY